MNETLPEIENVKAGASVASQTIRNLRMICEAIWPDAPMESGVNDFVNQAKNLRMMAGMSAQQHEELIHAVLGGNLLNHRMAVVSALANRSLSVSLEQHNLRLAVVLKIAESREVPGNLPEDIRGSLAVAAVISLLSDFLKADGYASARGTELTDVRAELDALKNDLAETKELLAEAERERNDAIANAQSASESAQKNAKVVASMHAAAMGEVRMPIRGVVEDVADVRARCLAAEEALSVALKPTEVPSPSPSKKGGK